MLQNIATALNKYDVVFAIFGSGHFESQRLALIDMMGKPKYITNVPSARGDFDGLKINPIKLIDFAPFQTINVFPYSSQLNK